MLEHLGYRVTATSSSVDALRIFYEAPGQFDLVITDLIMPNLTGDRLAEKILEVRPDIPLVAFTGFGENSHSEGSHLIMFKKIIVKPVSMREMGKAVRKVLDHQKPKNIEC